MRILITGGTGFIGKLIVGHLLQTGCIRLEGRQSRPIENITLFDTSQSEGIPSDPRVHLIAGDLGDSAAVERATRGVDLVWHLAAVVSAGAEADFDLGIRVNIKGLLTLLEALRSLAHRPRLVNASSFAVFGGELPAVVTDHTAVTPKSSYGMQKAVGELLVADYSRRGYVDGRSLRLPTIAVRPGRPNLAASTFVSSIVREPLSGKVVVCPVREETMVYVASPRMALASMIRAMELSEESIGSERTIPLPGITVSVGEIVTALVRVAGAEAARRISWEADPKIQCIVDGWPTHVHAERARALGFQSDTDIDSIIRAHIEDELQPGSTCG